MKKLVVFLVLVVFGAAFLAAQPDSESTKGPGVAVLDLTEIDGIPVSDAELALIVGGRATSFLEV